MTRISVQSCKQADSAVKIRVVSQVFDNDGWRGQVN